jgi:biopolymer transport protein ExbD
MPSLFSRTGSSGLIHATTYLAQLLAVLVLIMIAFHCRDRTPRGLLVRVVRPGVSLIPAAGIQPLRIHVVAGGLLANSKLIRAGEFASFLRSELAAWPPDWQVYMEGDRDVAFENVAKAIDVIRAAGAEVVLLTPGYGTYGTAAR